MDDEVGVAADGAGEMRVAAERQAEMAVIFGAVIGLRLGAEDLLHDLRLEIRLPDPLDDAVESGGPDHRSDEHTSELQSLMRSSYPVFCLKKKTNQYTSYNNQR